MTGSARVGESRPLRPGMDIPLRVESVAFGGAGVGRHEKQAVFVPFTAPADEITVTVTEVKKRYARGVIRDIVAASPLRLVPRCPYFTRCGGCAYQHLPYPLQLEIKTEQLRAVFRRIGNFSDPPVTAIIPSPQAFHYRGKGEFFIRRRREGPPAAGFLRRGSHELVEIERCEIVHESINDSLALLRGSESPGTGRREVRKVTIWSQTGISPGEFVTRQVLGKILLVPRNGFFQANLYLIPYLIAAVKEMCDLAGTETVIDAYGGSGLFSLFLAPLAGEVTGIEGQAGAARCARLNLDREGVTNADFVTGDVGTVLQEMFVRTGRTVDVVLLDPPRTGCEKGVLEATAALRPPRIVYVSCDPATLARDCRFLAGCGYVLQRLQPLDMFPQTAHIETICLLVPDGKRK